jgi:Uma2 family endonuclease
MSAILTPPTDQQTTKRVTPPDLNALVIRLGPLKHHLTDDEFFEFCQLNRDLRIEMTSEGEMIMMLPTGGEGGHRNFNLTGEFAAWAKADGSGIGFDSSTGFTLPNGAKRSPDLSWIRRERWEAIPKKQRKKFAPICPDFVVELRSETDALETLQAKLEEYLANGAQLGWLIDPLKKKVYIYRPHAAVEILDHPKSVSGEPLLQGLALDLTGILD